ncbi:MAG TPA: hypothetical protein VHW26_02960 [Solirubrobacteraceae bacterium]|jgi:hypothetical protein|nr:hypothetical protein [Solirubrobacteraceae bacterium]
MKQAKWVSALFITTAVGVGVGVGVPASAAVAATLPQVAAGFGLSQGVSVGGTLTAPASYSVAGLKALPQTTFAVPARGGAPAHADQGVSLEQLVETSAPVLPAAKNALLRVLVTVTPIAGLPVTFALGELDPSFGNHPAYVVVSQDGRAPLLAPELVVPGDSSDARTVIGVRQITVAVENPPASTPAHAGDLKIDAGLFTTVLTAAQLAALPAQTVHVQFTAGGPSPQTHTEVGPTLDEVLAAAHIPPTIVSWVAGVGSDDYVATVTPAEAHVGGRPLLISTSEDGIPQVQPRLVTDGDVKGGRYDSGLVDLVVGYPSYLSFLGLGSPLPW